MKTKFVDLHRRGKFEISRSKTSVYIYCPTSTSRYRRTWRMSPVKFRVMKKKFGLEGMILQLLDFHDPDLRIRKHEEVKFWG